MPDWLWSLMQVLVHVLGQQAGVPLTYLCRLISESAWHKYVVLQKRERGVVEKVRMCICAHTLSNTIVSMCV